MSQIACISYVLALFFSASCQLAFGQDTVFMNRHHFESPVRNVLKAEGEIYAKAGNFLYHKQGKRWTKLPSSFTKRFVFYDTAFFESDYIPDRFTFNPLPLQHLIPQDALTNPTLVRRGDQLFIAVGGALYEYKISTSYDRTFRKASIRDVFIDENIKVVSTYSGIYVNDSLVRGHPKYSNGYMERIESKYFLCTDELYQWTEENLFEKSQLKANEDQGQFRRLFEFENEVYAWLTLAIARVDSTHGLTSIHSGDFYSAMTTARDGIYFGTTAGELLFFDGTETAPLHNFSSSIDALVINQNILWIGTEEGMYIYEPKTGIIEKKLDLPLIHGLLFDIHRNLWLSTDNGLFVCPKDYEEPIPFITSVEFNKGALSFYESRIYAGSISGLYEIDVHSVIRDFLPKFQSNLSLAAEEEENGVWIYVLLLSISLIAVYILYRSKGSSESIKSEEDFSIEKIAKRIEEERIQSVDELAQVMDTNTVQLNRLFKTYNTTPGKFLREVKLRLADKLLRQNTPMQQVSQRVGYSPNYIKKNLIKNR